MDMPTLGITLIILTLYEYNLLFLSFFQLCLTTLFPVHFKNLFQFRNSFLTLLMVFALSLVV